MEELRFEDFPFLEIFSTCGVSPLKDKHACVRHAASPQLTPLPGGTPSPFAFERNAAAPLPSPPSRLGVTPSPLLSSSPYPSPPHFIAGAKSPACDVRAARRAHLCPSEVLSLSHHDNGVLGVLGEDTVLAGEVRFYSAANVGGG